MRQETKGKRQEGLEKIGVLALSVFFATLWFKKQVRRLQVEDATVAG